MAALPLLMVIVFVAPVLYLLIVLDWQHSIDVTAESSCLQWAPSVRPSVTLCRTWNYLALTHLVQKWVDVTVHESIVLSALTFSQLSLPGRHGPLVHIIPVVNVNRCLDAHKPGQPFSISGQLQSEYTSSLCTTLTGKAKATKSLYPAHELADGLCTHPPEARITADMLMPASVLRTDDFITLKSSLFNRAMHKPS